MSKSHLKILLVDCTPDHGEAIAQTFASEPGFTVQVAGTLREFRHLVAVPVFQRPSLVIMDLFLPDGSACEILSTPLEEGFFPVLIMVEPGREEGVLGAMQAGAIDYVVKSPWEIANMPHKVRRILREWNLFQERRTAKKIIEQLAFGWQQTFDAIPYPVFLRNVEGVITQCNQATLSFLDKTMEEVAGSYCWEVIHQTAEPIRECPLPAMLRSRQREIMIMPVGDRVFQVAVDPVINNNSDIIGAVHSMEDITERQRTEEFLRQTNERMKAVLDSLNALIYVADMTTYEILFVNKYGREVWGEIEGQICWQVLQSGQNGPCPFCTNDKLLKDDGSPAGVYVWEFQNGKNGQWYDCRDQAIRWRDGRLVRIEIATDITARKVAEEQIRHSQKMDTIGTLAGGIAHDFNNILTPILGFANLAHDDLPPESQTAKDIQQVIYAAGRAKELVKQILTFSRQRAEECQPVQASLLVKEALKLLRSSIPATIAIRDSITAQDQTIMIDPTKLHQVVMNLCTNAYQAMKAKGGSMSVTLEPVVFAEGSLFAQEKVEGEYLRLTVQDTGCGMDKATMERIFEPYFTTKGKEEGTGLGLSVVHGIVHSSKGFVAVQSTLGQGSVFQVIWPIVCQESLQLQQGPAVMSLPRGNNEHILLVDDEPAVLATKERELCALGYTVTSRNCPQEALELFQQSPESFALVLTDYAMPKMDGLTLAQKLLAISPGVKIVLATGFCDVLTAETMAANGIKKLLLKPVLRKDLAVAVRSVLDEQL